MITITFKVDTDEHGKVFVNATAVGMGNVKETIAAVAIFEAGRDAYEIVTKAAGGNPRTTLDPKSRITPLGQG